MSAAFGHAVLHSRGPGDYFAVRENLQAMHESCLRLHFVSRSEVLAPFQRSEENFVRICVSRYSTNGDSPLVDYSAGAFTASSYLEPEYSSGCASTISHKRYITQEASLIGTRANLEYLPGEG